MAAALYGVGARLDEKPELLFTLRKVDATDLVEGVDAGAALGNKATHERVLSGRDLSSVFGIELDGAEDVGAAVAMGPAPKEVAPRKRASRSRRAATLTAQELIERGVPRPTIQGWLRQGVLEATDARGVYRATPEAHERLASY